MAAGKEFLNGRSDGRSWSLRIASKKKTARSTAARARTSKVGSMIGKGWSIGELMACLVFYVQQKKKYWRQYFVHGKRSIKPAYRRIFFRKDRANDKPTFQPHLICIKVAFTRRTFSKKFIH